ncbi:hypothetical protein MKW94_010120 [Papaver nudicaule]|uniref:Uncharacterized protein n=1 Tax=Papaver nudicaule TaxID=74823 RepID=A0AA41S5S1_PAPNU|nr:hypothetical protein [Papaver nudicaule]
MVMTQEIQLAETTDLENPSSLLIKETMRKKLTLVPLIFLIFFEVLGGPFGEEPAVKAAGPAFALLGFLVFPFIWSIPEALITAELATAYPGNGGYVIWASEAFGPFWGSMMGSLKFLSGSINSAAYPAMMADYLKENLASFFTGKWQHPLALCVATIVLALLNYTGLTVVGWVAVGLGLVALIPLVAIIGALELTQNEWDNGYLATTAALISRPWLMYWVKIGSVLSNVGLFEAHLSSSSFQTEGMANLRFLPSFFAWRSKRFNTPWAGILLSSAVSLGVSFLKFENIVSLANFLYGMGMLLEFAAFIWLRIKKPDLHRPYKVPANVPALCILCLIPAGFVVYVMTLAKPVVYGISAGLTFIAVCNYFLMNFCKSKGCIKFDVKQDNDEQVVEKEKTFT